MNTDETAWLLRLGTFALAVLAGGLIVHGIWLTYHGDGKCHPVPVLTDDEMAEIILELEDRP